MKNSEWYHKLWRKKMEDYPLPDNADSAWLGMHNLLDKHLPVKQPSFIKKHVKSVSSQIAAKLGFVLPAAAMIGAVTYFAANHHIKNKPVNKPQITIKKITSTPDSALKQDSNASVSELIIPNEANTSNIQQGQVATTTDSIPTITSSFKPHNQFIAGIQKLSHVITGAQPYAGMQIPFSGLSVASVNTPAVIFLQDNILYGINTQAPGIPTAPGQYEVRARDIITGNTLYPITKNGLTGTPLIGPDGITVDDAGNITTNASGKRQKKSGKNQIKIKQTRPEKIARDHSQPDSSLFNYGLSVALNAAHSSGNISLGLRASYMVQPKWLINLGVGFDLNRPINSTYTRASYFPRDSSVTLHITDKRKVNTWSIPLTLEYQLSNKISINGGPQINIMVKQTRSTDGPAKYVGYVPQTRDTLGFSKSIDSALNKTTFNKINLGISAGVSIHLNNFYLDARYLQQVTPYQFNNSYFGNNRLHDRFIQLGVRYMFKK